jgi:hypothetical protein
LTSQAQVARFPDLQVSWNQFVEGCLPGDFSAFVHMNKFLQNKKRTKSKKKEDK